MLIKSRDHKTNFGLSVKVGKDSPMATHSLHTASPGGRNICSTLTLLAIASFMASSAHADEKEHIIPQSVAAPQLLDGFTGGNISGVKAVTPFEEQSREKARAAYLNPRRLAGISNGFEYRSEEASSASRLARSFSASLAARAESLAFSGELRASYSFAQKSSTTQKRISFTTTNKKLSANRVTLGQKSLPLTKEALDLARESPAKFEKKYGNRIVAGISYGSRVEGVITAETSNFDSEQELNIAVQAAYDALFGSGQVAAEASSKLSQASSTIKITVELSATGVSDEPIETFNVTSSGNAISTFRDNAQSFIRSMTKKPTPISVHTISASDLLEAYGITADQKELPDRSDVIASAYVIGQTAEGRIASLKKMLPDCDNIFPHLKGAVKPEIEREIAKYERASQLAFDTIDWLVKRGASPREVWSELLQQDPAVFPASEIAQYARLANHLTTIADGWGDLYQPLLPVVSLDRKALFEHTRYWQITLTISGPGADKVTPNVRRFSNYDRNTAVALANPPCRNEDGSYTWAFQPDRKDDPGPSPQVWIRLFTAEGQPVRLLLIGSDGRKHLSPRSSIQIVGSDVALPAEDRE